jgi:hypothetical protein
MRERESAHLEGELGGKVKGHVFQERFLSLEGRAAAREIATWRDP